MKTEERWHIELAKEIEEMHEPIMRAVIETAREEGIKKGIEEGDIEHVIRSHKKGRTFSEIADMFDISEERVRQIIENYKN